MDKKERVRLWAALVLVAIGKEAKDAVPILMEAQKLVDAMQRREKRRKLVAKILAIVLSIIYGLAGIGGIALAAIYAIKDGVYVGFIFLILLGLLFIFLCPAFVFYLIVIPIQLTSIPTSKGYQMDDLPPPSLSTSKVYQIEELPLGTRCMVSHLEIHLEMDELAACPYCEGIAKKELLEEWLEENYTCPVCRRTLRIEECPVVQIKEAEREKE